MQTRNAIKLNIVRDGGQAAKAGLVPHDIVVKIGSMSVDSHESLASAIAAVTAETPIQFIREGRLLVAKLLPGKLDVAYGVIEAEIPDAHASPLKSPEEAKADHERGLSEMIVTTAHNVDGYQVTRQLGVITAECVFGMNVFRDFFAAIRDVFGGRSQATQNVLRDARETCLTELKAEAIARGANAIIAVDLDYNEFSGDGKSMLFLVASGTAVYIEKA